MAGVQASEYRPNDYLYDPLFTLSSEKDLFKEQIKARMATVQFAVCPIFPSMFSDLPQYPRQQMVMRQPSLPPIFKRITKVCRSLNFTFPTAPDLVGRDWCKYFSRPRTPPVPPINLSTQHPCTPQLDSIKIRRKDTKKIQTRYRESSAQTSPWQPDFVLMEDCDPEILKLDFLKWGSGLPAGQHEVKLIQRARMKRKWEESMPPMIDEASMQKRREIIEAIEISEWAFREREIQDIQDLRLELLEQMLNELHEKSKTRSEMKMKMFCDMKEAEKNVKIAKLRHKTQRELRKLRLRKEGISRKYRPISVVEEHVNRKSELYGPQMRHGEHPKRWHQVIDDTMKTYKARFIGVEDLDTLPSWLEEITKKKGDFSPKLPGTHICVRESKWTTPVLKRLYEELKGLRTEPKMECTLRQKVEKPPETPPTPDPMEIDDEFETLFQATLIFQKVLRGRASQILIFEGRDTCRELIRELRTTHGLRIEEKLEKHEQRLEVMAQQRDRRNCQKKIDTVQEDLARLSGGIVGTLLDYLNKELQRILDERRAHALCLLAERERARREAAEAGRRQKELRRMKEHDEMFKQVIKIHQETVDLYLQDILLEGMEFASEEEAKFYVTKLADEVDDEAYRCQQSTNILEEEELIADLVHSFILPDVENKILREKMRKRQHERLRSVHDEVYNRIETLPLTKEEVPSEMEKPLSEGLLAEILEYLKEQEAASPGEGAEGGGAVATPDVWSQQHQLLLESLSKIEAEPTTTSIHEEKEEGEKVALAETKVEKQAEAPAYGKDETGPQKGKISKHPEDQGVKEAAGSPKKEETAASPPKAEKEKKKS